MTGKTRQHYIPQFYLRGFLDPTCPQGQEPYLWVYKKGRVIPRKRAPKNIAVESHFYSVETESGDKDSTVEDLLARVESQTAPLWSRLDDRRRHLSDEERVIIAEFIACMSTRVPSIRTMMDGVTDQVSRMILKITAVHYDDLSDGQRQEIGLSRDELAQAADSEKLHFRGSQAFHVGTMLDVVPRLVPVIHKMNWAFLHPPQNSVYITSDRPVTLVNPHIPPHMGGAGFGVRGVEVTFPINAHLCLFLTWEGPTVHLDIDENQITQINCRTAAFALEAVYAPTRLAWLNALFMKIAQESANIT
jgi:hypothetical protein